MNQKNENQKTTKVEEPAGVYDYSKLKFKGIDRATFDFDEEVRNGFTPEEAKTESIKRIKAWWGK